MPRKHREDQLAYQRDWYQANRAYVIAKTKAWKDRKKTAELHELLSMVNAAENKCAWCGSVPVYVMTGGRHSKPMRREYIYREWMMRKQRPILCGKCKKDMANNLHRRKWLSYWMNGPGRPLVTYGIGAYKKDASDERTFHRYHLDTRKRDEWHGACMAAYLLSPAAVESELAKDDVQYDVAMYWVMRCLRVRYIKDNDMAETGSPIPFECRRRTPFPWGSTEQVQHFGFSWERCK